MESPNQMNSLVAQEHGAQNARRRPTAHAIVCGVLGIVFLATAFLKGRPALTALFEHTGSYSPDWGTVGVAECEFLLAAWLLTGFAPRASRNFAIVFLAGLAVVAGTKVFSGAHSCGCAGQIEISPWRSLGFDLAAIGALILWKPLKGPACEAGSADAASFDPLGKWRFFT
jgi:hypothetical protein